MGKHKMFKDPLGEGYLPEDSLGAGYNGAKPDAIQDLEVNETEYDEQFVEKIDNLIKLAETLQPTVVQSSNLYGDKLGNPAPGQFLRTPGKGDLFRVLLTEKGEYFFERYPSRQVGDTDYVKGLDIETYIIDRFHGIRKLLVAPSDDYSAAFRRLDVNDDEVSDLLLDLETAQRCKRYKIH